MSDPERLYGINRLRDTLVVAESTRRTMQANKSTGSKPEVRLCNALWRAGLRGYRRNVRTLPGTPDIVLSRAKLAVFVHGCFWHGCPNCASGHRPKTNTAFWVEKVRRNTERHDRAVKELHAMGWTAATLWECELASDFDACVTDLLARCGIGE